MSGQGLDLLEKKLHAKYSGERNFDPSSIIAIITAIITAIQNCTNPTPAALKRKFGNRAKLAAALVGQGLKWLKAFQTADALFEMAQEHKDSELQSVIDDCAE